LNASTDFLIDRKNWDNIMLWKVKMLEGYIEERSGREEG
jgi:hypothetical protein